MSSFCIEADLTYLDSAIDFVSSKAAETGFNKIDLNRIRVAAEEIIVNIIHYAYPGGKGFIEIECEKYAEKKGLSIIFSDSGLPFDPLARIPPDTLKMPLEKRPIGGLGIHLVCSIMDLLSYRREGNKNILTLVKYLQ